MNKNKKYIIFLFFILCAFSISAFAVTGKKIQAIKEGEIVSGIRLYGFHGDQYLAVRDVSKLYNGSLKWHPVSGKVSLLMHNRRLDFFIKSTRIYLNGKKKRIDTPVHYHSKEAYIPINFLLSKDFSRFSETKSSWNSTTRILSIERNVNILSPRFYSEQENTRVVIEFGDNLRYRIDDTAKRQINIFFIRGRLAEEIIEVEDGVINKIYLGNKGREAKININLLEGAGKAKRKLLSNPTRLEIEIERTELAGDLPDSEYEEIVVEDSIIEDDIVPDIIQSVETTPAVSLKETESGKKDKKVIVLDAGHGGEDPGAIGPNGTKEKDINLIVTKELKRLLDRTGKFDVILTRGTDKFIPLVERTNIANEKKADLFISIHCNASLKRNSKGFEIYFLSENASDPEAAATAILENSVIKLEGKPSKKRAMLQELLWSLAKNEFINESSELCSLIKKEVVKRTRIEDRGVRQAGFYVLRGAQMPAVLVECAFISHVGEEVKLRNRSFQRKVADGIYEGIKRYEDRKNGNYAGR